MTEEIDQYRKDAERYRWLRSKSSCKYGPYFDMPMIDCLIGVGPDLPDTQFKTRFDACIDKTMVIEAGKK